MARTAVDPAVTGAPCAAITLFAVPVSRHASDTTTNALFTDKFGCLKFFENRCGGAPKETNAVPLLRERSDWRYGTSYAEGCLYASACPTSTCASSGGSGKARTRRTAVRTQQCVAFARRRIGNGF